MLCSISTGKSGSNWLDRLRSSKGFPAADQLDLEQFLNHNTPNLSNSSDGKVFGSTADQIDPNSSSNSVQSDKRQAIDGNQATETNCGNGESELFGVMNNVLSELFYMGDSKSFSKKSCRKQQNPKICILSTPKIDNDTCRKDEDVSGALPLSLNYSREMKGMSNKLKLQEGDGVNVGPVDGEEEEEKGNTDLSAFSRTEVTVIDTSFPSWKFEKMLFRRKNVWKVRDRKCKSTITNRRKRKASLVNESGYAGEEKKQCSSSKDANDEEGLVPSHEGNDQINKIEEACKQSYDVLGQVQENRIPRKLKDGASSVVLIKSIPTSKKNGANILKSCTKTVQRQHKA